jgi:hypothetical protein
VQQSRRPPAPPSPTPQIQTPLEEACKLSEQLGNTVLLKREDLQPVSPPARPLPLPLPLPLSLPPRAERSCAQPPGAA